MLCLKLGMSLKYLKCGHKDVSGKSVRGFEGTVVPLSRHRLSLTIENAPMITFEELYEIVAKPC